MNTEIAIRNNDENALAAQPDYIPVAGYEALGPNDFSLPTLKLVQAQTTADDAQRHLGHYLKTDTREFFEQPRALLIGINKSRILFEPEYQGKKADPLCRSDDACAPRGEFIGDNVLGETIPAECADCAFSRWGDDGAAPPCKLSENWAGILDSGDVVIVRFKGTSARASGMLKNVMRANRMKRRPTYVQLGSSFERSERGQYYVSTVTPLREPPPLESIDIAQQLVGINLAARAADEEPEEPRPPDDGFSQEEVPF